MRILVDLSHPAHVHFFKYAIQEWQLHGHQVQLVARDKDLTLRLLDEYGHEYVCLSQARKGIVGLAFEMVEHQLRLHKLVSKSRPDVMLDIGGTFIVHVGRVLGIRTIVFTDTEHARLSNSISFPFADMICTPACYKTDIGRKQVRYEGYQELAYLHPNQFSPRQAVLEEIGLNEDQDLFVVRFVSWGAAHDAGLVGFSLEGKRELVGRLSKLGRVIITSESPLPTEFEPYRMAISPTKIHDLLYYSSLYIGEGGTMASEAALLGVPSIYVNPLTMGYLEEEDKKYGLVHRITDERQAIELAVKLAKEPDATQVYQHRRQCLLNDKIDVTAWMVEMVENLK
jgi:predicted glycosyltransferase